MPIVAASVIAGAVVVVPGASADKDAPYEIAGPIVAVRSAGIGIVWVVAIHAVRGLSQLIVVVGAVVT